jgi:hypothetical protein
MAVGSHLHQSPGVSWRIKVVFAISRRDWRKKLQRMYNDHPMLLMAIET